MNDINLNQLNDSFWEIISKCSISILNNDDSLVDTYIYEDIDIDIETYFQDEYLCKLYTNGYINKEVFNKSKELKKIVQNLILKKRWSPLNIREDKDWESMFNLADEILKNKL